MPKGYKKDLTGQQFGRLRVVRRSEGVRPLSYLCVCACGTEKVVRSCNLNNEYSPTRSCGCLQRDVMVKHGASWTLEYSIWRTMTYRCRAESSPMFKNYGGRGIKVCETWRHSFAQFIADMGPRPSRKHSIERRNNDGDYEPGNCYWALPDVQHKNTRQTNRIVFNGKTQCLSDWAKELGMSAKTLSARIVRGCWDVEKALTTPVQKRYSHNIHTKGKV